MEYGSDLISIFTGLFYLLASHRLIGLSFRTRRHPELWLGCFFAASGLWYVVYNVPYLFGLDELPALVGASVEWIYALGAIGYLLFIRIVFRPDAAWAAALVFIGVALLLIGVTGASLISHYSISLESPWFLMEWIGYTIPSFWMCAEGFRAHVLARRRARIGLCPAIVANRYLLFAAFALLQILGSFAELLWASQLGTSSALEALVFHLLTGAEIASVAMLWLAVFPPTRYREWIARRAESS